MFLPPSSHLIEVFPYKYYKSTYVSLAAQFLLQYRALVSLRASSVSSGLWLQGVASGGVEQCMRDMRCRSFARRQSVCMTEAHVHEVLSVMREVETKKKRDFTPRPRIGGHATIYGNNILADMDQVRLSMGVMSHTQLKDASQSRDQGADAPV